MNKKLTCNQVISLLNYYFEGKLNPTLKEYVSLHIENCEHCKKKFQELQNIINKYSCPENKFSEENAVSIELKNNLSAYIDNELSYSDNIKIKKYTISNNNARKELELMYKFKKILHSAYEYTKKDLKKDYSKNIIKEIANDEYYVTTYFNKIIYLFLIIITGIIMCFIYLYF